MNAVWNKQQGKYRFTADFKESAVAAAKIELSFAGRDYSRQIAPGPDGQVFFENDALCFGVENRPDRRRKILVQTIRIKAKKEGVLKGRYITTLLCSSRSGKVFVPMFWAYTGDVGKLKRIDTHYPHYTWAEGYKKELRTPAVCAWDKGRVVTVAALGPHHPTRIVIEKCPEGLRFVVGLGRPRLGPDGYEANPTLAPGEELTASIYWDICPGDWQAGMQRWMGYNMAEIIGDDDPPPAWTGKVKMLWPRWIKIGKREIDEMAALKVDVLEVLSFTEPDPEVIAYAHAKGMKVFMEYMLLCYYKPPRLAHLDDKKRDGDDPHVIAANLETAKKHPDWCALKEDGSRHVEGFIYMCPNVEAFRKAKVKEAVDAVKRGYDGIRYDNALVLNCHSSEHKHTMTYAHAAARMLKEIKQAVRKVNPEAVVCANNAGPDLYSTLDMHMYESGLSSESFIYEQAGKGSLKGSSYAGAHDRMSTAKVLWEFAGKRFFVHDYPVHLKQGDGAIWRSAIFTVMHDGICSFGGATENKDGSRLPEYRIAGRLLAGIRNPLTEIINERNLAVRLYAPGAILIMETEGKVWDGTLKLPRLPVQADLEYELYSIPEDRVCLTAKGKSLTKGVPLTVAANGYDVLRIQRKTKQAK